MTQLSEIIVGFFGDYINGNYSYLESTALGSQNILANTPTVVQFANKLQDTDVIFNEVTGIITVPLSMNNANAVITSSVFSNSTVLTIEISTNGIDWNGIYRSVGQVNAILRLQTGMQIRVVAENTSPITIPSNARLSAVVLNAALGAGSPGTSVVQTGFEQHFLLMGA